MDEFLPFSFPQCPVGKLTLPSTETTHDSCSGSEAPDRFMEKVYD